ncbi:hypothetical protein PMI36_05575 [Pseudomonas sp. GM79]|uniref:hypothetical protein n=1 Tax=Pseudomonas sp. GM79 TaxID=1144338 RepID=UPI00026F7CBA|nr:hypothetical protein [Pseudomonas sp. GM79]EJN17241.1 hypothetical protein PMI36_05575 [Pseudomonas sp. GM79]
MSNDLIRQTQQEIDLSVMNMIKAYLYRTYGTRYPEEQRAKIADILATAVVVEFKGTDECKSLPPQEQGEHYLLKIVKSI